MLKELKHQLFKKYADEKKFYKFNVHPSLHSSMEYISYIYLLKQNGNDVSKKSLKSKYMNLCMRNMTNYLFFVCSEREIGTYLLCYINFWIENLSQRNREYYLKLNFILSCINTCSSYIYYILFKMTTNPYILLYKLWSFLCDYKGSALQKHKRYKKNERADLKHP